MWIRHTETKHATFAAADAARTKWANENTLSLATNGSKMRIKHRPDGSFDFIAWQWRERGSN